jgi:hypothetical protein
MIDLIRALSAHSNVNPSTLNQKGRNTMRSFIYYLTILMAALMAVTLILACGSPQGKSTTMSLGVEVRGSELCELAPVPDYAHCPPAVEIDLALRAGLNDEGGPVVLTEEFNVDLNDNVGSFSYEVPKSVVDDHPALVAQFSFANANLPQDYFFEKCGGGDPTSVPLPENNAVCYQIVYRGNADVTVNVEQGSGLGDACITVEDEDGNPVDVSDCTVRLDGSVVSGTDSACEGVFVEDASAKVYTVKVVCEGDLTGEDVVEISEDDQTDATVEVSLPPETGHTGSGLGSVSLSVEDSDGNPVTGCAWDFNSDQLDADCAKGNTATCSNVVVGTYTVDVSCNNGALAVDDSVFDVLEDETTAYTVVVAAPNTGSTGGSGRGSVSITVEDTSGNPVTGCAWDFSSDQLDADCTKGDSATCTDSLIGTYTVDVSCNNGALVKQGFVFGVLEDETTAYTVVVAAPNTGSTGGSGRGSVSLTVEDTSGNPVTGCAWDFSSDQLDADCTKGDSATYTVDVSCNNGALVKQGFVFGVLEDETTAYTVVVTEQGTVVVTPTTTGSVCATPVDFQGHLLEDCTFEVKQIGVVTSDPVPADVTCGDDSLYLELEAEEWDIVARCGDDSGSAPVTIRVGKHLAQDVYMYASIPDGDLCSEDHAFILDVYDADGRRDLQGQLGYGDGDGCDVLAPQDYTAMSVVSLSGPDCADLEDPNCRFTVVGVDSDPLVNGVYPHLLWQGDFSGMELNELLIYQMGIEDSGTGQSLSRAVWLYNGNALDL